MEYRSRRERREAERAGLLPAEAGSNASNQSPFVIADVKHEDFPAEQKPFPSRRELRNQANKGLEQEREAGSVELEKESTPDESQDNEESASGGNDVWFERKVSEQPGQTESEIEIKATDEPMTAKSYFYQESSNTITMDSIPDSLTATNGDLVVTNSESIAVVTGNHPSLSSIMEDLKYDSDDQKDTVAGKISLVDPVSAKLVAESREPEVVVPGKIVVRNRAVSMTFAILGGIMFVLAGIGLWWALSEMGPFSS